MIDLIALLGLGSPHRSRMPSSVHMRSAALSFMCDMPAPSFALRKSGRGGRIQSSVKSLHVSAIRRLSRSLLAAAPAHGHLSRRQQSPFTIRMQQSALRGPSIVMS